jgi:hypothetical protein
MTIKKGPLSVSRISLRARRYLFLKSRDAKQGGMAMKHINAVIVSLLIALSCIPQQVFAQRTYPEDLFKGCNSYKGWAFVAEGSQQISVNILNKSSGPIQINTMIHGQLRFLPIPRWIQPGSSFNWQVFPAWPVVLTDTQGSCVGALIAHQSQGVVIKDPKQAAEDWGRLNPAYDVVNTWSLPHPTTECFHHFDKYDFGGFTYKNVNIFCTAVVGFIGYDQKSPNNGT